jgi:hypothetical protein
MGSGCVESIYRSYKLCISPYSGIKLLHRPKQKPRRGGAKTDKHLPPNPFTGQFLRKDDLIT